MVRCSACGSTEGFTVVVPYKAASVSDLVGVNADGELVLEGIDAGSPSWFGRPEVCCDDCGHQWVSTRGWTRMKEVS